MTEPVVPAFRRMAEMIHSDLKIKPLVEAYLRAGKFPDVFNVTFRDESRERKPDGFFHPSTHPLMGERFLYYYLTQPDELIPEMIEYENRMAMIMGTAVGGFTEMCMIDAGILMKPKGTCVACGRVHGTKKDQCNQWGAFDIELGRRGHADGIIDIPDWGRGHFEFKTINPKAVYGLTDGNLDWLKDRHLDYYAQIQEYLDMMGYAKSIILFAILGFPWKLVEIEVPYDHQFVVAQRAKYARVREAVAEDELPDACCGPGSAQAKACEARTVCPVGRLSLTWTRHK